MRKYLTAATLALAAFSAGAQTLVQPQNGGTGVSNAAAETLTISGGFPITLTVTGNTNVTLPTSGTLGGDPNFKGQASSPTVTATGTNSLAAGSGASVGSGSTNGIAIGTNSSLGTNAIGSIAIGAGANAPANVDDGLAIGSGADANGDESVAIGMSTANGTQSIAIGRNAVNGGEAGITIGYGATTYGTSAGAGQIAIGRDAIVGTSAGSVVAIRGIAVGQSATVSGGATGSVSLGYTASVGASATNSIAIGPSATVSASATNGIAIGQSASAVIADAIAIGRSAVSGTSGANDSIAIGRESNARPQNTIAIGNNANVGQTGGTATASIAIGLSALVPTNRTNAIAFGPTAQVNGNNAIAIGSAANASGADALAIGASASAAANTLDVRWGGASRITGDSSGNVTFTGVVKTDSSFNLTSRFAVITAPTLASGGCTTPTAVTANGTMYFSVGVGTGCSGSQPLVFTLPSATNGWNCYARNSTNAASSAPAQSSGVSTTSVTITNYARTTGVAAAWTDSDVVVVSCAGG